MSARLVWGVPPRLSRHVRDARDRGGRPRHARDGGDPDHPITVGFLCGKVSNYLDRVYAEERLLHR